MDMSGIWRLKMTGEKTGAPLRFPPPTGNPASNRILNLKQKLGLSRAKLAEKLGVQEATVRGWERGRHQPSGPALILIQQIETLSGLYPRRGKKPNLKRESRNTRMVEMFNNGSSLNKIAKKFSCSRQNVHNILRQRGFEIGKLRDQKRTEKNLLITRKYKKGQSLDEIAKELNLPVLNVRGVLKMHGVEIPNNAGRKPDPKPESLCKRMEDLYRKGWSIQAIGQKLSCANQKVYRILKQRDVEMRNKGPSSRNSARNARMERMYLRGQSIVAIAETFALSSGYIYQIFKKRDVEMRKCGRRPAT